jgi:basic amino acid/polyamine antiporter, APA family
MSNKINLKESLGFIDVFFISLGYIIGAGIYSLIYLTTRYSGKYTWLSFIIGGFISLMTALSYRDLSEHFDTNASDYDYITQGLSMKLKYPVSYLIIFMLILTTTVLVIAFTNITKEIFKGAPYYLVLIMTILVPTLINMYDVKFTSNVNIGISLLETVVLIVLIFLNFASPQSASISNTLNFNITKQLTNIFKKIPDIFHGAFLTFFAYSGFETIPKLAEETKDSKKNIPRAIITSLVFTIILYVFVSISLNNVLGVSKVSQTKNPISLAFKSLLGSKTKPFIDFVTLMSIFNTILITLLFTSRQFKALSEKNILPQIFSKVNSTTKTPINSIVLIAGITLLLVLLLNINISSHFVNILLAILFVLINSSNIALYNKNIIKKERRPYYSYVGLVSTLYIVFELLKKIM